MALFRKGELTLLLGSRPRKASDAPEWLDAITTYISSCTCRIELDDVHDRRTAFMVAARKSQETSGNLYHIILHLIWNKYKELGCDVKAVLSQQLNYGLGNWSVFMNACKAGDKIALGIVHGFYKEAFHCHTKKKLKEMLSSHLHWAHVHHQVRDIVKQLTGNEDLKLISSYKRRTCRATMPAYQQSQRTANSDMQEKGNRGACQRASSVLRTPNICSPENQARKPAARPNGSAKKGTNIPQITSYEEEEMDNDERKPAAKPSSSLRRNAKRSISSSEEDESNRKSAAKLRKARSMPPNLSLEKGVDSDDDNQGTDTFHCEVAEDAPAKKHFRSNYPRMADSSNENDVIVLDESENEGFGAVTPAVTLSATQFSPTAAAARGSQTNTILLPAHVSATSQQLPTTNAMLSRVEQYLGLKGTEESGLLSRVALAEATLGKRSRGDLSERLAFLWKDLFG